MKNGPLLIMPCLKMTFEWARTKEYCRSYPGWPLLPDPHPPNYWTVDGHWSLKALAPVNPCKYGWGGGLLATPPPIFQRQSQKNLKNQKIWEIYIPLLRSLICTLCSDFYQNHLICLKNAFEPNKAEGKLGRHRVQKTATTASFFKVKNLAL